MKRCILSLPLLALAACHGGSRGPVYLERDVVRLIVLPAFNNSNDIEAPAKVWPMVQNHAAQRGFAVVPQSEVEAYYQSKRFTLAEEIDQVPVADLCAALKADGILYTTITYWGKETILISTKVKVDIEFRMIDKTKQEVWTGAGSDGKSSGGLTGRDIAGANAEMLLLSPAKFAPGAVANGMRSLPRAGFSPKPPPQPK